MRVLGKVLTDLLKPLLIRISLVTVLVGRRAIRILSVIRADEKVRQIFDF